MPSCRITNHTSEPLNICLKQVTALHFENSVQPGQTIKFKPGRVWFTLEARVDDNTKSTQYSVLKSAATIALLSLAVGAVAATAGAALLPEVAAMSAVAAAGTTGSMIAKGVTITKAAMITHSGTIAKLSSVALPKAMDRLTAEVGGLTALQREVLSIISSPTLSSDVRHRATTLLRSLSTAYTTDKASKSNTKSGSNPTIPASAEDRELAQELENGDMDDKVETSPVYGDNVLRVHKVFMDRRREFEVRRGRGGRLELWDSKEGVVWGT